MSSTELLAGIRPRYLAAIRERWEETRTCWPVGGVGEERCVYPCNDVPWLLAEVGRLQTENEGLRAVIERANANYGRLQVIRDNQHRVIVCASLLLELDDLDDAVLAAIEKALGDAHGGGEHGNESQ